MQARVREFWIIARREGRVDWSHFGKGNWGYHVGFVSADMRMASMYLVEE